MTFRAGRPAARSPDPGLRPLRRRARRLVAAVAAALVAWAPAVAWAGTPPAAGTPVRTGHGRVRLLGQTTWVRLGGVFTLDLAVTAPHPKQTVVQVAAFPPVTTRSGLEAAASGSEPYAANWYDVQPVDSLPADASGHGVLVRIPVGTSGSVPTGEKAFVPGSEVVYPLEVQLFEHGNAVGKAFTTFLVRAPDKGQVSQRLAVAVVVPLPAPAPRLDGHLGLVPPGTGRLSALTGALRSRRGAPVTLETDPEALQALAGGSGPDRQAVAAVAGLVARGDQVLPATYVPVDYRALASSGLADRIGPQLAAGGTVLGHLLGHEPSMRTWAVNRPLDRASLESLQLAGLQRLVAPASDLSALPPADRTVTFGRPTPLTGGAAPATVWGADQVLSSRLTERRRPVLAAEQDLAEMVMTQLEAPSVSRGVAVLAPRGIGPRVLSTLVSGLAANPFLQPTTVDGLFRRVPAPRGAPARHLVTTGPPGSVGDQPSLVGLSSALGAFERLAPAETGLAAAVHRALLVAESDRLGAGAGFGLVETASDRLRSWEQQVALPAATSITFTARAGTVPVTIRSRAHTRVHVRLVLTAPKLDFRAPHDAPGHCSTTAQSETCLLSVDRPLTTVRIPVESRTSGVFPLAIELSSPDGAVVLGTDRDTIRSTAVSWVGLVLMVGAGASLLLWWVRNFRHGRRARRLVPRPDDGPDGTGPGDESARSSVRAPTS